MSKKLAIRFDGPPSHESGRFIEVELDGAGVRYGEWEQDGDDWLLLLPDADARVAQLEADLRQALPYLKHLDYNLALAIQIEAHLEGKEPWETSK